MRPPESFVCDLKRLDPWLRVVWHRGRGLWRIIRLYGAPTRSGARMGSANHTLRVASAIDGETVHKLDEAGMHYMWIRGMDGKFRELERNAGMIFRAIRECDPWRKGGDQTDEMDEADARVKANQEYEADGEADQTFETSWNSQMRPTVISPREVFADYAAKGL